MINGDNDNDNNNDNNNKAKTITYRIKFIDGYRFMQSSLSPLTDNLSEINNMNLRISRDTLVKKFYNTYQLCDNDLISLIYY